MVNERLLGAATGKVVVVLSSKKPMVFI